MVMGKKLPLLALGVLATFSTARAQCEDIERYFGNVGSVSEIDLGSVIRVDCPPNDGGGPLEQILISPGQSLTIKSSEPYVRFVNVRFNVSEGSTLIFDMPLTRFGPNSGSEEGGSGYVLDVYDDSSVTFLGDFQGGGVKNVRSMFYNSGSIDFKGTARFYNSGNIFRSNTNGILKFRGYTVFKNNSWLALDLNGPESFVRFSKSVLFDNNARGFDGASGCAVDNFEGTVIFRGDAMFRNHRCDEGSAVRNGGKMRFYGKAQFDDNTSQSDNGGALRNFDGTLIFKKAVQFNRNTAETGGALYVSGGEVTFNKAVKFDTNGVDVTGGAFALTSDGSLTFEKPDVVRTTGNYIVPPFTDTPRTGCTLAFVEEGTTLVGFDVEDLCVEDTVNP